MCLRGSKAFLSLMANFSQHSGIPCGLFPKKKPLKKIMITITNNHIHKQLKTFVSGFH